MAIENRNLEIGTKLTASYKKQTYTCTLEAAAEGEGIVYALEDGRKFKSPSAAASAITKVAQNGWRFWSVDGEGAAPGSDAAVSAPKQRKPRGARNQAQEAPAAATQPEGFDYEIDSDGRPVAQGDTPGAVETDAAAEAIEAEA